MKTKLPSHTTRYFAQEAYRLYFYNGINRPMTCKTVDGVELVVTMTSDRTAYVVTWANGYKVETIRKSWVY